MDSGIPVSPMAAGEGPVPAAVQSNFDLPVPAILFFLALIVLLFLQVLTPLVQQWFNDENMGYAFFVPLVAGYVVWLDRARIMEAPVKPCWSALTMVVAGFLFMLLGLLAALSVLARLGLWFTAVGVVWTIAGTAVLRTLLFPLGLLLFMFPIPLYVYQRMTLPLQTIATQMAALGLSAIGIPVLREGNTLTLADKTLDVVEACSGIRSLLSLTFLSVAYGRLFEDRMWARIVLLVATVPIAILCNAARIVLTGILTQYAPAIAEGAYHAFEGWVIFMFELVTLLTFHRILERFGKRSHA
jgi:exosortase